jgi:hypothetical protein
MKTQLFQHKLIVKKSPIHGYGVFASVDLAEDELIEECYCLFYKCDNNCLNNYAFRSKSPDVVWNDSESEYVMLTGYGCIYNHSDDSNAYFCIDKENRLMLFKARRPIRAGEEILTNYGKDWFSARNIQSKKLPLWHGALFNRYTAILLKCLIIVGIYYVIMTLEKYVI